MGAGNGKNFVLASPVCTAAVAIVLAPLLSFGIERIYNDWLSGNPSWKNLFGPRLNFMHRVFIVFVLCIAVQIAMSLQLNYKLGENFLDTSMKFKCTVFYIII